MLSIPRNFLISPPPCISLCISPCLTTILCRAPSPVLPLLGLCPREPGLSSLFTLSPLLDHLSRCPPLLCSHWRSFPGLCPISGSLSHLFDHCPFHACLLPPPLSSASSLTPLLTPSRLCASWFPHFIPSSHPPTPPSIWVPSFPSTPSIAFPAVSSCLWSLYVSFLPLSLSVSPFLPVSLSSFVSLYASAAAPSLTQLSPLILTLHLPHYLGLTVSVAFPISVSRSLSPPSVSFSLISVPHLCFPPCRPLPLSITQPSPLAPSLPCLPSGSALASRPRRGRPAGPAGDARRRWPPRPSGPR